MTRIHDGGAAAPMTAREEALGRELAETRVQLRLREDALRLLAASADRYVKDLRGRAPGSHWRDRFEVALQNARRYVSA